MKINKFTILLKELRENSGLSMRDLSALLKISPTYYSDLENGNRFPSANIIESIITVFNLNQESQRILYDAAAKATNSIPLDIEKFLLNNPEELQKVIEAMNVSQNKIYKN